MAGVTSDATDAVAILQANGCQPFSSEDADGDGIKAGAGPGYDCDDGDEDISPNAPEVCDDTVDNDCDDEVDELDCVVIADIDPAIPCVGALDCNDGNPCTQDACVQGSCSFVEIEADDGPCSTEGS